MNIHCSEMGCKYEADAQGLCLPHYAFGKAAAPKHRPERPDICSLKACSRKHHAKNYCFMHYQRFISTGDPHNTKHKQSGLYATPEYRIWQNMKGRCLNKNHPAYKNYGARGIKVCQEWLDSVEAFVRDMGRRPDHKLSLDRIDNDGNYEPSNCRWATTSEQNSNRRKNKLLQSG